MSKNNRLIEHYKKIYKPMYDQIQQITPKVYASVAIAMHRKGYEFEEIENIFADSQAIWTECLQLDVNMLQMCKNETGIDVLNGEIEVGEE